MEYLTGLKSIYKTNLLDSLTSLPSNSEILLIDNIFNIAFWISISAFIISIVNKNYSQVDRLWSILPIFYVLYLITHSELNLKMIIVSLIISTWGSRLTYNFWRKGGYKKGEEDYRWGYLKKNIITNEILYEIFNFTFISFYQIFIITFFTFPTYVIYINRNKGISSYEIIFIVLSLLCILGETIADQQQWNFHDLKIKGKAKGFNTKGLFRYSRHPNFFFEICFWWCIYFLGAASEGSLYNFTILGPILLNLLFMGSTPFTENITKSKYPLYESYQKDVSRIIPWFSNFNEKKYS